MASFRSSRVSLKLRLPFKHASIALVATWHCRRSDLVISTNPSGLAHSTHARQDNKSYTAKIAPPIGRTPERVLRPPGFSIQFLARCQVRYGLTKSVYDAYFGIVIGDSKTGAAWLRSSGSGRGFVGNLLPSVFSLFGPGQSPLFSKGPPALPCRRGTD